VPSRYPEKTRRIVEGGLERYFSGTNYPPQLSEPMSYSLFSGGKRFRGILVIESARIFGLAAEDVLPTACALEYIHTYSLIHDDLPALDNDDLRRSKPTCHKVYGENMAILAGDALNTEAFNLISSSQRADTAERIVRVIRELASAAGAAGMVGGQVVDIISEGAAIDTDTLSYIHEKKTGELITASVRCGGILGGANEAELESLTRYARNLGLAFQITDDILDVVGDTAVLGKSVGSDERKEKATFPEIYGLEVAREMANETVNSAKKALEGLSGDTSVLADLADFVCERQF
jgi:geranylgeranyl diphosphate synthase type II